MGRRRKEPAKVENALSPDDLIAMLAMHHAQAVTISKTIQSGFSALVTAMGARPDPSLYPDPTEIFMAAFDEMTGEPEEEDEKIPPAEDAGATTGE